jgi:hypothetical protein
LVLVALSARTPHVILNVTFPKAVHDELISDGQAEPHRGSFPAVVSYYFRGPEDLPGAVDLFRMSYERARAAAERRKKGHRD